MLSEPRDEDRRAMWKIITDAFGGMGELCSGFSYTTLSRAMENPYVGWNLVRRGKILWAFGWFLRNGFTRRGIEKKLRRRGLNPDQQCFVIHLTDKKPESAQVPEAVNGIPIVVYEYVPVAYLL